MVLLLQTFLRIFLKLQEPKISLPFQRGFSRVNFLVAHSEMSQTLPLPIRQDEAAMQFLRMGFKNILKNGLQ